MLYILNQKLKFGEKCYLKFPSNKLPPEEANALSIMSPRINAADTSIMPVKIDTRPDKLRTLKLPLNDQIKKPLRYLGGGPLALADGFIHVDGFM